MDVVGRFNTLQEFCGGLATGFPGTSTVDSDFYETARILFSSYLRLYEYFSLNQFPTHLFHVHRLSVSTAHIRLSPTRFRLTPHRMTQYQHLINSLETEEAEYFERYAR